MRKITQHSIIVRNYTSLHHLFRRWEKQESGASEGQEKTRFGILSPRLHFQTFQFQTLHFPFSFFLNFPLKIRKLTRTSRKNQRFYATPPAVIVTRSRPEAENQIPPFRLVPSYACALHLSVGLSGFYDNDSSSKFSVAGDKMKLKRFLLRYYPPGAERFTAELGGRERGSCGCQLLWEESSAGKDRDDGESDKALGAGKRRLWEDRQYGKG